MAAFVAKGKQLDQEVGEAPKSHRIRITLTSQDVSGLEKGEFLIDFDYLCHGAWRFYERMSRVTLA